MAVEQMEQKYLFETKQKKYNITLFINDKKEYRINIRVSGGGQTKEFTIDNSLYCWSKVFTFYERLQIIIPFIMFEYRYFIGEKNDTIDIHRINLAVNAEERKDFKVLRINNRNIQM